MRPALAAPVFCCASHTRASMPSAARIHLRWMTAAHSRHGRQRPSLGDGLARASRTSPRSAAISRPAASGASLSRRARKPPPHRPPSSLTSAPTTCPAMFASSIFSRRPSPSRHGSTCIAFSNRSARRCPRSTTQTPARRAMLVEDVGQLSLLDAVRRPGADAADLFRLAAEELLRFHVEGTARIDHRCVASQIAYSGRLFEWEFKEFSEVGLAAVAPGADSSLIAPELADIAARLDRYPRVFSHRDYHRENLFIAGRPAPSHHRFPGCVDGAGRTGPRSAADNSRHR